MDPSNQWQCHSINVNQFLSVLILKVPFEHLKFFQALLGIHILSSALYYLRMNDHPFMLFQACMRPYSFYDTPIFYALKQDSALAFTYNFTIVAGNFYLFQFLKSQTENNKALNSVDKKKERKRNFVNAKSGIMSGFILTISITIYTSFYGLQVPLKGTH